MDDKALKLYSFIQERYLWQFYSRTWDREENIEGILTKAVKLLSGQKLQAEDNSKDRYFYAEAVTVADEIKKKFPWLGEMSGEQIKDAFDAVRDKLIDVTVTNSLNGELNIPNY